MLWFDVDPYHKCCDEAQRHLPDELSHTAESVVRVGGSQVLRFGEKGGDSFGKRKKQLGFLRDFIFLFWDLMGSLLDFYGILLDFNGISW